LSALDTLKGLDIAGATLTFWVFKKYGSAGQAPRYVGRWVGTTDELDTVLKDAVTAERDRIEEVQQYGLLSQNNESSALSIDTIETHAGLIVEQAAGETAQKKAEELKKLQNSDFYVIKFVAGDTVIHAVRKTDASWRTKRALNAISVFFSDQELGLDSTASFDISRYVDFFVVGDAILVSNKANFESILFYKQAHQADFAALQAEPEFISVFANLDAIVAHVGENKIQLRRASAIRLKGYYKDADFMANLRTQYQNFGLNLQFDGDGKIVPTPETCRDIFQALLDHRLASGFSKNIYDVPDAIAVNV
jgi:hypothetical protein